jgi:Rubrerythrin.
MRKNPLLPYIRDEKDDIKEYRQGAKKIAKKDPQTARLMRSIAKDETEHRNRLIKRSKSL